jgi:hypothetical protein
VCIVYRIVKKKALAGDNFWISGHDITSRTHVLAAISSSSPDTFSVKVRGQSSSRWGRVSSTCRLANEPRIRPPRPGRGHVVRRCILHSACTRRCTRARACVVWRPNKLVAAFERQLGTKCLSSRQIRYKVTLFSLEKRHPFEGNCQLNSPRYVSNVYVASNSCLELSGGHACSSQPLSS